MDSFQKIAGCVVVSAENIAELLAQFPQQGKRELEPLKTFSKMTGMPLNVLEDTNIENNEIEVHTQMADLWYCLEGEEIFSLGGTLTDARHKLNKDGSVNEQEIRGTAATGASEIVLKKGDWLWIPSGVPHTHAASGTARIAIIKIPHTA